MDSSPRTRLSDSLKGFAYLNSFEELQRWTESDVDPIQRSNTPLAVREGNTRETGKTKVMLIHDYKGGYLDYEACQGSEISQGMYSCEHLPFVETFVYFSHHLVTVPPPTWVNTCHRNGVKVLGTFIIEPDTLEAECVLELRRDQFWVATTLARIARCYGFDGWLVNIEKSFPLSKWNPQKLERFLISLRSSLDTGCQVVWYDALTTLNLVWHQNTLNYLNLSFALAAGAILTNYAWTPSMASQAEQIALRSGLSPDNVYFGIDVWAQNVQHGLNKRVTYPRSGGGGTGTGSGVRELARHRVQTGIFAPAWSFEHFSGNHQAIDDALWLGSHLPKDLVCDCRPKTPHTTVSYQENYITKFARCFHGVTNSYFYTNFTRSPNQQDGNCGEGYLGTEAVHLGRQSLLPATDPTGISFWNYQHDQSYPALLMTRLERNPTRLAVSIQAQAGLPLDKMLARGYLFDTNITLHTPMELFVSYKKAATSGYSIKLLADCRDCCEFVFPDHAEENRTSTALRIPNGRPISGIDLLVEGKLREPTDGRLDILEIFEIAIRPCGQPKLEWTIQDPRIEWRGTSGLPHYRLIWNIVSTEQTTGYDFIATPTSEITGGFAYFDIRFHGKKIGTAYALEFVISSDMEKHAYGLGDLPTDVEIDGYGFHGALLHTLSVRLVWPDMTDDDWVVVQRSMDATPTV